MIPNLGFYTQVSDDKNKDISIEAKEANKLSKRKGKKSITYKERGSSSRNSVTSGVRKKRKKPSLKAPVIISLDRYSAINEKREG